MVHGRYGTWEIWYMEDMVHGDMVHGRYGTSKIWYMGDMVHGGYGTWEILYMGDMVHGSSKIDDVHDLVQYQNIDVLTLC